MLQISNCDGSDSSDQKTFLHKFCFVNYFFYNKTSSQKKNLNSNCDKTQNLKL